MSILVLSFMRFTGLLCEKRALFSLKSPGEWDVEELRKLRISHVRYSGSVACLHGIVNIPAEADA